MTKLHIDILLALKPAGKFGLDLNTLLSDLRAQRYRALTLPELERAVRDLADKALVHFFVSALESKRWRITGLR